MKNLLWIAAALMLGTGPVAAAEDAQLARLAFCKESWLDWKSDPARLDALGAHIIAGYRRRDNEPYFVPKTEGSVAGLRIEQLYPHSVGMGVGFSMLVAAPFEKSRRVARQVLGKDLEHCEHGEGMTTCERTIAEKRTFMLLSEDDMPGKTLIGCYYYYEK